MIVVSYVFFLITPIFNKNKETIYYKLAKY